MRPVKAIIDFFMDILETVVFIGSLFIVVYLFIMQPNQVKGESMVPTFQNADYILTSKITYKFRNYKRGDVVVFKSPKNPEIDYIKRIIGLPGDKILFKGSNVYINDSLLSESYISAPNNLWDNGYAKEGETIVVPDNYVFVMGDNRPHSSDSREFGPIPITDIIGHVFYRYFPANQVGVIKNPLSLNTKTLSF